MKKILMFIIFTSLLSTASLLYAQQSNEVDIVVTNKSDRTFTIMAKQHLGGDSVREKDISPNQVVHIRFKADPPAPGAYNRIYLSISRTTPGIPRPYNLFGDNVCLKAKFEIYKTPDNAGGEYDVRDDYSACDSP